MKNGKRKLSLRARDGVVDVVARPVSPLSLRGMGQGLASGYHALVDTTSQGMEAVARPFSHPPGYTPAVVGAPAPVAAPQAPAPAAAPQLGGVNVEAIQRREAAAGLADGTPFVSPYSVRGIGQSLRGGYDSVVGHTADMMEAAHNHFGTPAGYTPAVVPSAVPVAAPAPAPVGPAPTVGGAVDAIHQHQQDLQNLANGTGMVRGPGGPIDDKVPAKLSPGESVLPADTTAAIGPENIQHLIDQTHTPAHLQKRGVPPGGRHGLRLANGIAGLDVSEAPFNENDARMFGQRPAGTVPAPQPQVPGVEVNEPFAPRTGAMPQPQVQGMRVSYPVTDPGPGNPNVDRMGPQRPATPNPVAEPAPAAVAEPAAAAAADGAGAAARAGGMAYRAGRLAATGLRAAPQLLLANELAHNVGSTKVSNDVAPVDSSAMGTLRYAASGDWDNAGESLRKGAVEAGGDLLKAGAGFGDIFLPGTPLTDRVNARLRSDLGDSAAPVRTAPAVATGAAPAVQPSDTNPADQRAQANTLAPPLNNDVIPGGAQAGKIMRRGNSFTNTGTFAEDENTGAPSAANMAAADRVAARSTGGLRGGLDDTPNLPAGAGLTVPGQNGVPASQYETELAARNASVHSMEEGRGMNANQRRQAALEQQRIAQTGNIAGQHDATERRGQDVNAEVARGGQRVSLRGQDLNFESSMFGHNVTAAGTRARLAYEVGKDNRDYNLRAAEFGQKREESAFNQNEKADQTLQRNLEARYQTTDAKGNVVPDAKKIGDYRATVNATVPALAKELEATGNPQAIAKAADLRKRGVAALDPEDHARLTQLFDLRERMAQARGIGPNQGTYAHSDNLLDYRQLPGQAGVDRRTFGGNRIVTPAGSVSVNDLRYADAPANDFFPDFNKVGERNLTRGLRTE